LENPLLFCPSSRWEQGGVIIARQGISVMLRYGHCAPHNDVWDALVKPETWSTGCKGSGVRAETFASGPHPLVAAMRCHVISRVGNHIQLPEELLSEKHA